MVNQQQKIHSTLSRIFSDEEKIIVNGVYAKLKAIYAGNYDLTFKTARDEKASKREWSEDILKLSAEQVATGLDGVKNNDDKYPSLKSFIQLSRTAKKNPIHAEYQLPKPCNIDREEGKKRASALRTIQPLSREDRLALQAEMKQQSRQEQGA